MARVFETLEQADAFMETNIDKPVLELEQNLNNGAVLQPYSVILSDGCFTNIYDINYPKNNLRPIINLYNGLETVANAALQADENNITTNAGFFLLSDSILPIPKKPTLQLCMIAGKVHNLPVMDGEILSIVEGQFVAKKAQALGRLGLNGTGLTWAGSLTEWEADCIVYGNANAVIGHHNASKTNTAREIEPTSHFTPPISSKDDLVDIGFVLEADGSLLGSSLSNKGRLDIFQYNFVVRCHRDLVAINQPNVLVLHSLDKENLAGTTTSAITIGPLFNELSFDDHPLNKARCLGDKPPFTARRMARLVLFETLDEQIHLQLLDGRPSSKTFSGVTPVETIGIISQRHKLAWGCFLDPGQSAKICIRQNDKLTSFGNQHYLKWPKNPSEPFIWTPQQGRPVATTLTLQ